MKNKKHNKKTRKRSISITSDKELTIPLGQELLISYQKGRAILMNKNRIPYDIGLQSMIKTYQGLTKERVVAQATNLKYITDQLGSWILNFDYIFAIDTNSHPFIINDFYCSATMVYYGKPNQTNEYSGVLNCIPYMIIDWYHDEGVKMEPIAWSETIKVLQTKIPSNKKVGIVVDSELGNLKGYNNRSIPVTEQWYLPDNYTLMYATADVTDDWCNQMIRICDKSATKRLREIIDSPKLKYNPSKSKVPPIGLISLFNEELTL